MEVTVVMALIVVLKKSVPTPTPKITPAPKGNSREKELIVPPVLPKIKNPPNLLLN